MHGYPGQRDLERAVADLAAGLPAELGPLASLAYDLRWSWTPGGDEVFAALAPQRWDRFGHNPVWLLRTLSRHRLEQAAADAAYLERLAALQRTVDAETAPLELPEGLDADRPVAFLCSEYAVHPSLPVYSGGLGVLAGDILKEASDQGLPMVGVGLLYRSGYFHQRLDTSGWQHEYWTDTHPETLPAVVVTDDRGQELRVTLPVDDEVLSVRVWRVSVGRVPLYLLDTDVEDNSAVGRWVTSRLYEGNRAIRLAQYAVLGVGGMRALAAMGIDPAVVHLNEGHPALAAFELQGRSVAGGAGPAAAWAATRDRLVFTTHTPVAAGNETYGRDEILPVLGRYLEELGEVEDALAAGRLDPGRPDEPSGMTALALRASSSVNGVSRRHGAVARSMWRAVFPEVGSDDDVPITSVTNGVHLPTWMSPPVRSLLDRALGPDWVQRADDPATWAPLEGVTDEDLWAARTEARRLLIEMTRSRATADRLRRGEDLGYANAADRTLDPDVLTIGFARRLATYKRLHVLMLDPERALRLLGGERPVQFLFAGRAHPQDDEAKRVVQTLFGYKGREGVPGRVVFLEDYDLALAPLIVAGCDLWVNMPRPPLEASGTSGMKAAMNGSLNLSVLDGWWAEAYDGHNGWAIDGAVDPDTGAQDRRHADALFTLLEQEIVPRFHRRDDSGIPADWLATVRRSMQTIGPRFSATRMVKDYLRDIYPLDRRAARRVAAWR